MIAIHGDYLLVVGMFALLAVYAHLQARHHDEEQMRVLQEKQRREERDFLRGLYQTPAALYSDREENRFGTARDDADHRGTVCVRENAAAERI